MSKSLVKLVVTTVVLATLGSVVALFVFSYASWTDDDMRKAGLFWAFAELDQTPAAERDAKREELQHVIDAPIELVSPAKLEARLGRRLPAGERGAVRTGRREAWLAAAFHDHTGGAVFGPIDPINPGGQFPIGLLIGAILCPLIAVGITWRISRQLAKIEHASKAIGSGDLKARIDNPSGPSAELANSFNDMARQIEKSVRDRDELLQAVSHELGSPLARLRFQLELLGGEDTSTASSPERLEAMAQQIDELDQLVEDLLRWVQSDEAALRGELFDAAAPLPNLAELAQLDRPITSQVSIELDVPESATLTADPRLYQRAVDNLLRNAVRYGSEQCVLNLRATTDHVVITVEDDGPGIPPEHRERVLEPFTRLQSDRDRRAGGVGLGLSIVNRIVKSHGGTLTIDESPLGGARVTLTWRRR